MSHPGMNTTTREQSLAALQIGNRTRVRRAEVRRAIAALPRRESRLEAMAVLIDPEPSCVGMSAYHLLISIRALGPRTVTSFLMRAAVPQQKPIGELTERQRAKLIDLLERA